MQLKERSDDFKDGYSEAEYDVEGECVKNISLLLGRFRSKAKVLGLSDYQLGYYTYLLDNKNELLLKGE
jgi:hypothetical protein